MNSRKEPHPVKKNHAFRNRPASSGPKGGFPSFLLGILAFCIPVLLYAHTLNYGFSGLDDDFIIKRNIDFFADFSNAPKAFLTNAFLKQSDYYRPLQTLSYMADLQISGKNNIWMFHLSNILLVGLISFLLFILLKRHFAPPGLALSGALIYCVHPLFVSAAAWIPSRGDLLLTLFSILSFLFLVRFLESAKPLHLILHWIAFTLALFSKETAAFLPFVFILYFCTFHRENPFRKIYILNVCLYAVSAAFWLWLRSKAVSHYFSGDNSHFFESFLGNLRVFPESLFSFVLPFHLNPLPVFSVLKTLSGLAVIAMIAVLFIRNKERPTKHKAFCILWIVLLTSPTMFFRHRYFDYLDHRFLLPLIGLLLFLLMIIPSNWKSDAKTKLHLCSFIIVALLCGSSFLQSRTYSNPEIFYDSVIEINPSSFISYFNRGHYYYETNQLKKALADFDITLKLNPGHSDAYYNRGLAYNAAAEYDKALADYTSAIKLNPRFMEAYNNRGVAYCLTRQYNKAIPDHDKALELDPFNGDAYNNRGFAYYNLNQFDRAIADFNKSIELNPESSMAYKNRGSLYLHDNKIDKAISDFEKVAHLENSLSAFKNLGAVYYIAKNYSKAIDEYSEAISLSGGDLQSYHFRALSYFKISKKELSCSDWSKAAELGDPDSRYFLAQYCR
jgi:tetratricopeptide (TPR) repeat protein